MIGADPTAREPLVASEEYAIGWPTRVLDALRAIWEQDPLDLWGRTGVPTLAIVAHGTDADHDARARRAVARVREITHGRAVTISWMRGIHDLPVQHPESLARRIERFARSAVG